MFGIFKRKSEKEKLQQKYNSMVKQAYELSKVNRLQSDRIYAEAGRVLDQIEALDK